MLLKTLTARILVSGRAGEVRSPGWYLKRHGGIATYPRSLKTPERRHTRRSVDGVTLHSSSLVSAFQASRTSAQQCGVMTMA